MVSRIEGSQHNDFEDQQFELHYKGDDVKSVGEITYDVDTIAGGFGGSGFTLEGNGTLKDSTEANPTNAKIIEDSEVEVTIEWNDRTEIIILTNN